jgi:plasmid stability protein
MAQLVVRRLEEATVRKLRERAAKAGISMEEEHRRILRAALGEARKARNFKEHLLSIPTGNGEIVRRRTTGRRKTES